jgi:hypothetical protein
VSESFPGGEAGRGWREMGRKGDRNHPRLGAKHWCFGQSSRKEARRKKNKRGVSECNHPTPKSRPMRSQSLNCIAFALHSRERKQASSSQACMGSWRSTAPAVGRMWVPSRPSHLHTRKVRRGGAPLHEPMNSRDSPSGRSSSTTIPFFPPTSSHQPTMGRERGGRQTTFVPLPAMKLPTAPDECRMARPAARHLMPRAGLPTQRASKASNRSATSSGILRLGQEGVRNGQSQGAARHHGRDLES